MKNRKTKKITSDFLIINFLITQLHWTAENKKKALRQAMQGIQKILKADGIALWTIEEPTQFMKIMVAVGLSLRYINYFNKTDRIRIGHGVVGRVIQEGKTILSEKALKDERIELVRWREIIQEEGISSFLSASMFVGLEKIGALNIYYKQTHHFTPEEVQLAEILAHHFALFLSRDKAHRQKEETIQKLVEYRKRMLNLRDVVGFLGLRVRQPLQKALKLITEQTLWDFGGSGIIIFQKEKRNLLLIESYGFSKFSQNYLHKHPLRLNMAVPASRAFIKQQIQAIPKVLIEDDVLKFWKTLLANEGFIGECALPLTVRENPIGVLGVYYPREHQYLPEELSILGTIAHVIAVSLENLQSFRSLATQREELEKARTATLNILEDVEEARLSSEEERDKTKAIIANFADGLIVLDKENRVTLINPGAERLLGIKAKTLEGKILTSFTQPYSLKRLTQLLAAKEEKDGLFRKELFFKQPQEQVLEVTTVSLTPRAENVIILHDISREKLIERMKTEFVSLAAHQLRTPLSAIKWTLKMLLDGDLGEITKEQEEFIGKTYRSNERMINIINDLLDVTRIEEGRYLYKPAFAQIENIIQLVINSYQEEIKEKRIKFKFKTPKVKLPKIKIDIEKMRLAIQNLFDNAIRYTPLGGEVKVSLKHAKKKIEFQIQDNGMGIPEDQKERIFTKFFRGTNVVRMETDGTGLGLFIAKNIIEAHGGKIWFESKEGKGTAFYFTLPTKEEFSEFLKEF